MLSFIVYVKVVFFDDRLVEVYGLIIVEVILVVAYLLQFADEVALVQEV